MQQFRQHVRHLRASSRTRLAIVAAPQIFPLVGPLIVCSPIALALALSFVFQPLLLPRGLRLQPIELAVETVAVRGRNRRYASLATTILLLPLLCLLLLLLPILCLLLLPPLLGLLLLLLLLLWFVGARKPLVTVRSVRVAYLHMNKKDDGVSAPPSRYVRCVTQLGMGVNVQLYAVQNHV